MYGKEILIIFFFKSFMVSRLMVTSSLLKYQALKMVRDLLTARGEESKPFQNFRVGMQDIIL